MSGMEAIPPNQATIPWHRVKQMLKRAWDEGYDDGANDVGSGWREDELTPNPYDKED